MFQCPLTLSTVNSVEGHWLRTKKTKHFPQLLRNTITIGDPFSAQPFPDRGSDGSGRGSVVIEVVFNLHDGWVSEAFIFYDLELPDAH